MFTALPPLLNLPFSDPFKSRIFIKILTISTSLSSPHHKKPLFQTFSYQIFFAYFLTHLSFVTMDHKQLMLHELLQQHQEPFHLKTYLSEKRSQLQNSSPPTALHLKRRSSTAFLQVPSRTADVLGDAAAKIQKQRRSKPKPQIKSIGICLFGSLLKILKNRSKIRVLRNSGLNEKENSEDIRTSCSCNSLNRDGLRASTSNHRPELFYEIGDFELREARFLSSPFRFCLHKSPSSPAASPIHSVKQEKENSAAGQDELHNVSEEKEQSSPVCVLDTFFEDDAHESVVEEEEDDDDDFERSYANIERARQQLLDRLRRFEKLAALDPVDLEQKLLEASDDEYQKDDDIKRGSDTASLEQTPMKMKRLLCNNGFFHNKEIDVVVEMDFKAELDEWRRSAEVVAAEVEQLIFGDLMEELSDDFCIDVTPSSSSTTLLSNHKLMFNFL